jgi:hypothetical protein
LMICEKGSSPSKISSPGWYSMSSFYFSNYQLGI